MLLILVVVISLLILLCIRRWGLSSSGEILTPPPPDEPRINCSRLFGVRPGSPFFFKIAATGKLPLTFDADNLPHGLNADVSTGIITGTIKEAGSYKVRLSVKNNLGSVSTDLEIRCGEEICLTPPMGWNSWYCWSEAVSHDNIRKAAAAMDASGLADHGWTYINIDDCWQGERRGEAGAIQGNEKFPDMPGLCDYIHDRGLKAGIYSTPWMGSYAGFVGGTEPEEGYDEYALPADKRRQPGQLFGRYPRAIRKGMGEVGPRWHCDADARQWAAWGFDYVKYDWNPNDTPTTERLHEELKNCGRDIVFSISNTAPYENARGLSRLANCWRNTGDITDRWWSISYIVSRQKKWLKFSAPGHFNDPDMLQVGSFGMPNRGDGKFKKSRLLPVEQYSQVSLWCIMGAPLMLSCDLSGIDDFTRGLLTNDEVLSVNQDPLGAVPRCIPAGFMREVWLREMYDGSIAVCFFNRFPFRFRIKLNLEGAGLFSSCIGRDIWRQKDLGIFEGEVSCTVPGHGVVMMKLTQVSDEEV